MHRIRPHPVGETGRKSEKVGCQVSFYMIVFNCNLEKEVYEMQAFVNELVIGLFVKNPLFWFLMILTIVSTAFYKQIIGKMGEIWTSGELIHFIKIMDM